MDIDFIKIKEIYGEDIIFQTKENYEDVIENIKYLITLGFNDVEDIFEREVFLFLYDPKTFKEKITKLINDIGNNYVELIENNIELLEVLL